MPQLQTISLLDREATPVAHIFVPFDIKDGVGTVIRSTGVAIGDEILTVSGRKVNGKRKGTLRLTVPTVQTSTINGISEPVVVRKAYGEINVTFDEKSTTQERKNLMGMLADACLSAKVLVNSTFVDLEGVY